VANRSSPLTIRLLQVVGCLVADNRREGDVVALEADGFLRFCMWWKPSLGSTQTITSPSPLRVLRPACSRSRANTHVTGPSGVPNMSVTASGSLGSQ
jgi:hypothetical protein